MLPILVFCRVRREVIALPLRLLLLVVTPFVALGLVTSTVTAQSEATVEVRVWQGVSNAHNLHISARPAGGSWRTLGTIPLDMSGLSSRGTFTYGDITVAVPLSGARAPSQVNVEVRVWQSVTDPLDLYISARLEGRSWRALGTVPLDMSGLSARGFRFGDVALSARLPFLGRGQTGTTWYEAKYHEDGSLYSLATVSDGNSRWPGHGESSFAFRCLRGNLQTVIHVRGSYEWDHRTLVELSVDEEEPTAERWSLASGVSGDYYYAPDPEDLLEHLRGASSLRIRLIDSDGFVRLTEEGDLHIYQHDVASLLTTPVQMNLERCGEEGWR